MTWRGPHAALTEADRDALPPYLGGDLCTRDIARELGWEFNKVYRVADKFGLPVRARPRPPVRDVAALVADMRPIEAVEYLVEAYLNLTGESPDRERQLIADYRLRVQDAKIYAVLEGRAGEIVSHDWLETVLTQSGYEGMGHRNRLGVSMHYIRRRIAEAGLPVVIETIPRAGYRLKHIPPAA